MARVALEQALKKPGRVLTWHAGAGCRSHRSSDREDYYTVLPPELAGFVHRFGSDTTEPEVLELFLDDMLVDLAIEEAEFRALHADDPLVPAMPAGAVLFEIRGYFQGCLEFYVTQHAAPPTDPFRRSPEPRWLILASPNVRSAVAQRPAARPDARSGDRPRRLPKHAETEVIAPNVPGKRAYSSRHTRLKGFRAQNRSG